MDQEQYLEGTPLGRIILRGIKKLVTEMTSTKFLLLVFINLLNRASGSIYAGNSGT